MTTVNITLNRTDWPLLAEQKLALIEMISTAPSDHVEPLTGLLHFIDAIQDAAHGEGFPVVFLTSNEDEA